MDIAFTEKEIDMICKYYGVYNFEEDENTGMYWDGSRLISIYTKQDIDRDKIKIIIAIKTSNIVKNVKI